MKKYLFVLPLLFLVSTSFAETKTDLEYRVSRLEMDLQSVKYDLRDEKWQRESLERRVSYLEQKQLEQQEFLDLLSSINLEKTGMEK